ncbi:hypothetical protein BMS3Abin10_02116 [bacterium BMS3Abin10]|nr:hypothetical protein BMS3Abin10_02116 [bacterium BMS3Abin10]
MRNKNKVNSSQYGVCANHSGSRKNFTVRILLLSAYCLLLSIYLLPTIAYAHKVSIYAYAEDGMVFSEGYFADGTRSRNSLIEVIDTKTGKKLLEGKTDNDGKFSFKIPKATSLKLILHASMGHQNDYTLDEEEVREAIGVSKAEDREQITESSPRLSEPTSPLPATSEVSSSEIEAIVGKAIDSKLQPVIRILLKLQENSEKPGITEILGGIGYIMGLMGIVMYFKSRRRKV